MRLINARTLELHEFYPSTVPPYTIFSHVWGHDEVTFQDMSSPSRFTKEGYMKISETCRLALKQGLEFVWVDTCCVDKSSSAELTESLNSMFQWYMNAVVCYVSLSDLSRDTPTEEGLTRCRWFTRGWTLQELIAPRRVEFYDMTWAYRGSKLDFAHRISDFTGIRTGVLLGHKDLASYSVATRMSWASRRQTTLVEDTAYCLLGIFDVNMPLIYGEGVRAFRRLQEEIVKRNSDLTIFAWDSPRCHDQPFLGLFATSPAAFAGSSGFWPYTDDFPEFSVTNKGLLVSGDVPLRIVIVTGEEGDQEAVRYLLCLGSIGAAVGMEGGLYLRKVGPTLFCRDGRLPLAGWGRNEFRHHKTFDSTDYYILIDPTANQTIAASTFRSDAVHVPFGDLFSLEDSVPETLWDATDRIFLRPKPYPWTHYPMVLAMRFVGTLAGTKVRLVVLCNYSNPVPTCSVFRLDEYLSEMEMLFLGRNRKESLYWADLAIQAPRIPFLSNCVEIRGSDARFTISVSLDKEVVESISSGVELFSLNFNISPIQYYSKE